MGSDGYGKKWPRGAGLSTTQVRIEPVGGETPWAVEGVGALAFLEEETATFEIP
jgi:hypothetical protein